VKSGILTLDVNLVPGTVRDRLFHPFNNLAFSSLLYCIFPSMISYFMEVYAPFSFSGRSASFDGYENLL
jgi:hypothetical protein